MKNAHERFGELVYRRRSEKTATNLRVFLDAFVGEDRGKAHLVSVVGGDVEIGALAAAFANGDSFTVEDPCGEEGVVSLGEKPLCFRGSIVVPGRKRPLRHLVSCSQELSDTTSDGKLLLISDDHLFIWSSLVRHYGLPATPEDVGREEHPSYHPGRKGPMYIIICLMYISTIIAALGRMIRGHSNETNP